MAATLLRAAIPRGSYGGDADARARGRDQRGDGDEREGGDLDGEQDAAGERVAEHEDAAGDDR